MALVYAQGFDSWATGSLPAENTPPTISTNGCTITSVETAGAWSSAALLCATDAHRFVKNLGAHTDMSIAAWVWPRSASGATTRSHILGVWAASDSGDADPTYSFTRSGNSSFVLRKSGSVVATLTAPFVIEKWYHLEMTLSQTKVKLYIDGFIELDYDIPSPLGDYVYAGVGRRAGSTWSAPFCYYDDLCMYNDSDGSHGVTKLVRRQPKADESVVNYDLSSGSDAYALLDETTPDDADYVENDTGAIGEVLVSNPDSVSMTEVSENVAVVVQIRAEQTETTTEVIAVESGTSSASAAPNRLGVMGYSQAIFAVDPDTSAAWTATAIQDSSFGVVTPT